MAKSEFSPLDYVTSCLEQVLAASTADETELVWLQRKHGWSRSEPDAEPEGAVESPRLTVLIRVIESGRLGWFRTETPDAAELEDGVRHALAMARSQPKVKRRPVLPTDKAEVRSTARLHDRKISQLSVDSAQAFQRRHCCDGLSSYFHWSETRVAIFNSHGLRRTAAATEATLTVLTDRGPGCGRACGSARTLAKLKPEAICERARIHHGSGDVAALPREPVPVLLSPEATIELLDVLNTYALAGRAYLDGTSVLSQHRGVQVFDRSFNLRDDGTDAAGLAFPFDLEGTPKRPLELIVEGKPSTPALNQYQGAEAGLVPTAQAVGGQDALFGNLVLQCGEATPEQLLAAADGGIRVGWLEHPECFEPSQLRLRAIARSARRIESGRLGAPLPDFVWEESLLRALARLRAIGDQPVVRATPTTLFGGITAPAVVLADSQGFQPLKNRRR